MTLAWSGFLDYLERQRKWSVATFGDGIRAEGVCQHIEKELVEIRSEPEDVMEWVDVVILALDGAMRSGADPNQLLDALVEKQRINFAREWPAPTGEDKAVEHIRIPSPSPQGQGESK